MTNEEKLMDLYRHKGYTDGQARAAARQMLTDIRRDADLQVGALQKLLERALDAVRDHDFGKGHKYGVLCVDIRAALGEESLTEKPNSVAVFCLDHMKVMVDGVCPKCIST